MDESRFDIWTRRRVGQATGGALTVVFGRPVFLDAASRRQKRKRRKNRCRGLNQPCRRKKGRRCCNDLLCGQSQEGGRRCCRRVQSPCITIDECCGDLLCENVPALGGLHCCANETRSCQVANDCCFGIGCLNNVCVD